MARGSKIVINPDAEGVWDWGYLASGEKPGTILQIDPTVALKAGKHTWKVYTGGADGAIPIGPFAVLDFNQYQAMDANTAYTTGDFAKLYFPEAGDEINLLFYNQAGTADDVALGDALIVRNAVGKVFKTTGSPATKIAVALEALVDPIADQLIWTRWSGH